MNFTGFELTVQVALKVIKHCQEEGSSSELVTGILVGLVVGKTLEITNCFPLPKDDEHEDDSMLPHKQSSTTGSEITCRQWPNSVHFIEMAMHVHRHLGQIKIIIL